MDRIKLNLHTSAGLRSSVTIDEFLYHYFAASLQFDPDDKTTQLRCEKWLESRLAYLPCDRLSFRVRSLIVAQIAKPSLQRKIQQHLEPQKRSDRAGQ